MAHTSITRLTSSLNLTPHHLTSPLITCFFCLGKDSVSRILSGHAPLLVQDWCAPPEAPHLVGGKVRMEWRWRGVVVEEASNKIKGYCGMQDL